VRTLISLAVLAGMVWFSFAVELGDKTLAEHVDTISATPEAKQLLEGTRQTIDPALADVRDRMLGEYVEAPTFIAQDQIEPRVDAPEPALPGRRRRPEPRAEQESPEPERPGRRLRPNVLASIEPASAPEPPRPGWRRRPNALASIEPAPIRPSEPPPPIARPVQFPELPWPRSEIDDRSFLDPMLDLARSLPRAPKPTPIPIVAPDIDPALPELPSSR
jgi:hypothetical protein